MVKQAAHTANRAERNPCYVTRSCHAPSFSVECVPGREPIPPSPAGTDQRQDLMTELSTPVAAPAERPFTQLCQVTITNDEQISGINQLLADGWRLVEVGFRQDSTVYVLGRTDEKPRNRAGFLPAS